MKTTTAVLTVGLAILLSGPQNSAGKLIDLIPGLYGGDGLLLGTKPDANHTAHFAILSTAAINRLN